MLIHRVRHPAVLVDLDDTLLDHRSAARDALLAWARTAGATDDDGELERRWAALETEYYRRYQRGELTKEEQRRARVRSFLRREDLDDATADDAFGGYWSAYEGGWRAFPDALPMLRGALASGRRVAVLTNGDELDQARKIASTDLRDLNLPLFASSMLGAAKPEPRCFAVACDRIGVGPEECLMVGNSVADDIAGARAAGIAAVLLDRYDQHPDHDGPRIRSLDQLRWTC